MINLCIVDDDLRLANQIRTDLIEYPELNWIKTCDSGLAYFKSLKTQQPPEELPDCVLMDISMRVPDEGIYATRLFHQQFPLIKIIIFTISDDDDRVFEAFRSGAVGYLLKNEKPPFIFKTIVEVMNGGALMSPGIALKTIKFLTGTLEKKIETLQTHPRLTEREMEILRLISKGFRYQQVADQLSISNQTVKKHISNIFEKLNVNNKIEALNKSREFL